MLCMCIHIYEIMNWKCIFLPIINIIENYCLSKFHLPLSPALVSSQVLSCSSRV